MQIAFLELELCSCLCTVKKLSSSYASDKT